MAKIPGWAYAGTGLAITLYSKFVQSRNGSSVMTLFFWIGIAILIFGVFKMVLGFILGKKGKIERRPSNPGNNPASARGYGNHIICPSCNAKLDPRSRYCNWCGAKQ